MINTEHKNEELLREQYINNRLTEMQISKKYKVSRSTIHKWLEEFNIPKRSHSEANIKINAKYTDNKWLKKRYINKKMSTRKIAEICRTSSSVIWRWLKIFEIPIRTFSEALIGIIHTDEWNKNNSKARKGIPRLNCRGENCHFWKGGITPENEKIKNSIEYRLWRESVFARDNWICQDCNKRGGKINAHHIKSFAEYPELRFAIDNGITLCENCHKKTKSYLHYHGKKNRSVETNGNK